MTDQTLEEQFEQRFGLPSTHRFFAPGRINLIGEHTDYNGGHVFPCALTFGTHAIARKRDDQRFRFYSLNFEQDGIIEVALDELAYDATHGWANYAKGMITVLQEAGYRIDTGCDILIQGDIPNGAGLSSSASLELVIGVLLDRLYGLEIPRLDLVRFGQQVENRYIGVNSGIMDQFAIGMGKAGAGLLLDCETLDYTYAPLDLTGYTIIIMNTNKRRELADSKYNERRAECEAALAYLNQFTPREALGQWTTSEFAKVAWEEEILMRRARHAISENERTLQALAALEAGELTTFGQLMNASHVSLREDYEVTGIELDTLVEAAWEQPGVLGARMTGAGFGGCAIAIVEDEVVDAFKQSVGEHYEARIGYPATFYTATVGDGAREIEREVI
ncbi:galactokinase [Exiguobacterium sp. A1_3_1]|uniref:Galactokinase n=1 Tax=Exiguobacterium indicum TaxID=296995 RepID=A0ABU8ELM8_9BACL|nr:MULTISPECIES: galactokinase [Exiguobacterium]NTY08344.1 galactokinase [Exiguobacterium sp. JMULE1]